MFWVLKRIFSMRLFFSGPKKHTKINGKKNSQFHTEKISLISTYACHSVGFVMKWLLCFFLFFRELLQFAKENDEAVKQIAER